MDKHTISRFSSGISTASGTDGVPYHYPYPDPFKAYIYFNDFIQYAAADWTITTTEEGAGSASEALTNVAGGNLLITNVANDNDSDEFQLLGESFLMVAGKQTWFQSRFQVSDATDSDFSLGLIITDTAFIDGFTDGVVFKKDDGDVNIDFLSYKDSAGESEAAITTCADDTYLTLGFYFDGTDFFLYKDDVMVKRVASATIPDNEVLTVSFGIQNGEAVAKTMTMDYILAAQER